MPGLEGALQLVDLIVLVGAGSHMALSLDLELEAMSCDALSMV